MPYVYVIHFDRPLHHAQHYAGVTSSLRDRLTAHATGGGSRICQALIEQGIDWQLGGLYEVTIAEMRRQERHLKNQAHASKYCQRCGIVTRRIPNMLPIDISSVRFSTRSEDLRNNAAIKGYTVRFVQDGEPKTTADAILHMMRRDKDALGFIPVNAQAGGMESLIPKQCIAIAERDSEVIAYAAHTLSPSKHRVTIHQCCVRDDARLLGIGKSLVHLIEHRYTDSSLIVAKVREDLAANHFWEAIGFENTGAEKHKTSGNMINQYHLTKQENGPWQQLSTDTHASTATQTNTPETTNSAET